MRKGQMKALSFVLTASLLLSGMSTGIEVYAAADSQQTAEAAVTEEQTEESTEMVSGTVAEEDVTGETAGKTSETEAVSTEEKITEAAVTEEQTESSTETVEATTQHKKANARKGRTGAASTTITDTNLLKALAELMKVSEADVVGKLPNYSGTLDFSNCQNAAAITSVAGLGMAKNATEINLGALTGLKTIEDSEFAGCNVQKLTLPDTLEEIGEHAFENCKSLIQIDSESTAGTNENTIPGSLKKVGQQAFANDVALKEITLSLSESNGRILENSASLFAGCAALTKITIGKYITTIPVSAFSGAGSDTNEGVTITFESGSKLEKILGSAFKGAKLPEKSELDFSNCNSLQSIESAFEDAKNLQTVILPKTVPAFKFGNRTFAKTELTTMYASGSQAENGVVLPDYVTAIGEGCFYGNTKLTAVKLSSKLTSIPDYAFDGCTALAAVTAPANCGVTALGDCAFRSTAIADTKFLLNMPKLKDIGTQRLTADECGITTNDVPYKEDDILTYCSLPLGGENDNNNEIKIDGGQKYNSKRSNYHYGSEVFSNCANLTEVSLPASVENIGSRAFYYGVKDNIKNSTLANKIPECTIQTVTWQAATQGAGVERRIYPEAFHGCISMQTLTLPDHTGDSLYIDDYAFYYCQSLDAINTDNKLPATMKALGDGAFWHCEALPAITIQLTADKTCPELGKYAFQSCIALKEITLPEGTKVVPAHFCYKAPIEKFDVGTAITKFDTLCFCGNQLTELDLSGYKQLEEIGSGAFSLYDVIIEPEFGSSAQNKPDQDVASGEPTLTKVVLPAKSDLKNENGNTLFLNSAPFCGHTTLTTLGPKGTAEKTYYLPDYIQEASDSQGIFQATGVSKVTWEADTTGVNQWTTIPVHAYTDCLNITEAKDVLPAGDYVETIGKAAFRESSVVSADLSAYTKLSLIGSGTVSNSLYPGVFQECKKLESVTLPESEFVIGEKTFFQDTALKSVELGKAAKIEKNGFAQCSSLQTIAFPDTLTELGDYAFAMGQETSLSKVKFGGVVKIGNNAFENCAELDLSQEGCGLPDSLETIGSSAFKKAIAGGKVSFGSNLTKIMGNAFEESGLTEVDFTKAGKLNDIAASAFTKSALKEFNISGTMVTTIRSTVLKDCPNLTKASFGDEVLSIENNALAGCPKLQTLEFASTTTVDTQICYATGNRKKDDGVTNETVYTGMDTTGIVITVRTPEKTVVPAGRTFKFPYYVNPKGKSHFDYILIGNMSSPDDIDTHIKVSAKLEDGYYKKSNADTEGGKYRIPEGEYYEKLGTAPTIKTSANKEVDTIQIEGLSAVEGLVDFNIACRLNLECADKEHPTIPTNPFVVNYHLEIKELPVYADLYEGYKSSQFENPISDGVTTNMQAINNQKGAFQCWYDIKDSEETYTTPDSYDVVVETDNADVLYPAANQSGAKQESYTTAATTTAATGVVTGNPSRQNFWLVGAGVGTATITVYPKGCPQYARKYTYVVNSSIKALNLAVPREYNQAKVGDTFSIISSCENYFGQKVTPDNISALSQYTNDVITYTSSEPDYVTVNSDGVVTIVKADKAQKRVKVTATYGTANTKKEVTITIAADSSATTGGTSSGGTTGGTTGDSGNTTQGPVKVNDKKEDSITGATVTVTKPGQKDLEGTVEYTAPKNKDGASVVVPDTVTINGVKYQVTTIAANLFKNNTKLETITIGKYVTSIGTEAFSGCTNLKTVTISASVKKIGKKAFYNCKKLKTVSFANGSGLQEIGVSAFQNCSALTKITIPAKVTKIGSKAFYNCKKLKTVTIKSTVLKSVGKQAFKNIHKKAKIKVPKKQYSKYKKLLKGKVQPKTVKIKK